MMQHLLRAGLMQAIARLEQIMDAENDALGADATRFDWTLRTARKQQATFEFQRLLRQPGARDLLAGDRDALARLRALAQANLRLISLHVQAGRDICERLAAVIREAEWDGTYGPRASQGQSR